jgi:uncharacterized protein (TIGR03435 family)
MSANSAFPYCRGLILGIWLVAVSVGAGQSFEVASVRLSKPPAQSSLGPLPGGERFVARNMPLIWLIGAAYHVTNRQISGLSQEQANQGYDIEAKAEHAVNREQMMALLRALLEDRFHLVVRRETKEMRTHVLVVAKGGPKLGESQDGGELTIKKVNASKSIYHNMSMPVFATLLAYPVEDTVLDQTGLKGTYDFTLDYMPEHLGPGVVEGREPGPNPNAPALDAALEQQLGLRLEVRKGPVEMLVIEHIEKLSGN